jgi:hypothetical protein
MNAVLSVLRNEAKGHAKRMEGKRHTYLTYAKGTGGNERRVVGRLHNHPVSLCCDISQRAGILIGNVVQLRGPVIKWRSICEAVFLLER